MADPASMLPPGFKMMEPPQPPPGFKMIDAPAPQGGAAASSDWGPYVKGLVRSAARGATLNWSDEIEALASKFTGGDYEAALAKIRDEMDAFRRENPKAAIAAELAGGFAVPGLTGVKLAGKATTLGGKMIGGAVTGAAQGAAAVAGDAEDVTAEKLPQLGIDMGRGALMGGGIGAALPVALQGASSAWRSLATIAPEHTNPNPLLAMAGRVTRPTKERVALEQIDDALARDAALGGRTRAQHLDEIKRALDDDRYGPTGTGGATILGVSANKIDDRVGENLQELNKRAANRSNEAQAMNRRAIREADDALPSGDYDRFYLRGNVTRRTDTRDLQQLVRGNPAIRNAYVQAHREMRTANVTPPPNGQFSAELLHRMDQNLRTMAERAQKDLRNQSRADAIGTARGSLQNIIERAFPDQPGMPSLSTIQKTTAIGKDQIRNAERTITRPGDEVSLADAGHNVVRGTLAAGLGRTNYAAQSWLRAAQRIAGGDLDRGTAIVRILTERVGRSGIDPVSEIPRYLRALENMPAARRSKYLDALIQAESQQVGANVKQQ